VSGEQEIKRSSRLFVPKSGLGKKQKQHQKRRHAFLRPIYPLEPRERTVMKDDTWKIIDDSVYSPTTIRLGILHALQSASHRNKSMHNLDVFIDNLIYERKQIILDENGVSLSKSMYIPYEIMSTELLAAMTLLVDSVATRSFFTQDENVHTCFECPLPGDNNTLGVVNVLCGFLLGINECGHLNDSNRPYNSNLLSVFDVILKSILFKHSIDFSVVMENCVRSHICLQM